MGHVAGTRFLFSGGGPNHRTLWRIASWPTFDYLHLSFHFKLSSFVFRVGVLSHRTPRPIQFFIVLAELHIHTPNEIMINWWSGNFILQLYPCDFSDYGRYFSVGENYLVVECEDLYFIIFIFHDFRTMRLKHSSFLVYKEVHNNKK